MGVNNFILKRVLIAGLLFGICMAVIPPYFGGIIPSIIKGMIAGIFFAIPIYLLWIFLFLLIQRPPKNKDLPAIINPNNEKIIYSSYAVFNQEEQKIRGKLYLLENTLQFQPYNLKKLEEIFLIHLIKIEKLDSFKIIKQAPEGLSITTNDGKVAKFISFETFIWIKLINEQITKLK